MKYIVNGEERTREHNFITSYAELLESIGESHDRILSITWAKQDSRCGSVMPGQTLVVTDGTIINIADTSKA